METVIKLRASGEQRLVHRLRNRTPQNRNRTAHSTSPPLCVHRQAGYEAKSGEHLSFKRTRALLLRSFPSWRMVEIGKAGG